MRISLRRMPRLVKASLLGVVTTSLLTVGMAAPASANTPPPSQEISWQNGLYNQTYFLAAGGMDGQPWMLKPTTNDYRMTWFDVENSDGTWNEVDVYGYCLTAYGRVVEEMPCNWARDATDGHMRWREINMGPGNGWKLQNVLNGYYLDWTGSSPNTGTVYAHDGDANNSNERWY